MAVKKASSPGGVGHNRPANIRVEMDDEMAEFVEKNCDANISYGLLAIDPVRGAVKSPDIAAKMVAQIENFKLLRTLVRDARRRRDGK